MKTAISSLLLIGLTACAATYVPPPSSQLPPMETSTTASAQKLIRASQRVLIESGYSISAISESAGVVSTSPRTMRLTQAQADCGRTMGIDYLLDVRTVTRVAIGVIASDGRLRVTSSIDGEFKPGGNGVGDIVLTCRSRDDIERDIIARILDEAGR